MSDQPVYVVPPKPTPAKKKRSPSRARGTTARDVVDLTGVRPVQRALYRAHQVFLSDPDVALEDVWRHARVDPEDPGSPAIGDLIPWDKFSAHVRKEGWKAEKDLFWRGVQERVLARAQLKIVEEQVAELAEFDRIERLLQAQVATTAPKSLEGLVGALVKLDAAKEKKRGSVAAQLAQAAKASQPAIPGQPATGTLAEADANAPHALPDRMSEEEIAALARTIAAQRAGVVLAPEAP